MSAFDPKRTSRRRRSNQFYALRRVPDRRRIGSLLVRLRCFIGKLNAEAKSIVGHETVRFWWNRFGPMFANEIRKRRIEPKPAL